MTTIARVAGGVLAVTMAAATHAQCIQGDVNGDGVVNGADLAQLLGSWGECP